MLGAASGNVRAGNRLGNYRRKSMATDKVLFWYIFIPTIGWYFCAESFELAYSYTRTVMDAVAIWGLWRWAEFGEVLARASQGKVAETKRQT